MQSNTWPTIRDKLLSDRLWALAAFPLIAVANHKLELGLTKEELEQFFWVIVTFIGGKSLRGSKVLGESATLFSKAATPGTTVEDLKSQGVAVGKAAVEEAVSGELPPPRRPAGSSGAAVVVLLAGFLTLGAGCATGKSVLVNSNTMSAHVAFLGARTAASAPLLLAAAEDSRKSGDRASCLKWAEEYLVAEYRVPWHEAKALVLLDYPGAEDPGEKPALPALESICGPELAPAPVPAPEPAKEDVSQ